MSSSNSLKYSFPYLYTYSNANCGGTPSTTTHMNASCSMTHVEISASSVTLTNYGTFTEINPSIILPPLNLTLPNTSLANGVMATKAFHKGIIVFISILMFNVWKF
jgi:hypothetical protein